ncbi:MAG: ADP-ribosylglycohydrolase family protein [Pseudomonadota bacterium]
MSLKEWTEEQFRGALLGCAVGDSLGAPLEGLSREAIAKVEDFTSVFKPFRGYQAGQYTDDTQLTMAIAESICRMGCVDGADIAKSFVILWDSDEIVGAGPVAKEAVEQLKAGVSWREAANRDGKSFNGAAMRAGPLGLWESSDLEQRQHAVTDASIITHAHPDAIAAALVVANAVAAPCSPTDAKPFLEYVIAGVQDISPTVAQYITELTKWWMIDEGRLLARIVEVTGQKPMPGFGISVLASPTILTALAALLRSPEDYLQTIKFTIRAGGDVDTTAAIAGAISGAHLGIAAIPENLVRDIKDSEHINNVARQLFALKQS